MSEVEVNVNVILDIIWIQHIIVFNVIILAGNALIIIHAQIVNIHIEILQHAYVKLITMMLVLDYVHLLLIIVEHIVKIVYPQVLHIFVKLVL